MSARKNLWTGLTTLVYPHLCLGCEQPLADRSGDSICIKCQRQLPETLNWETTENRMSDRLAGRLRLDSAAALYTYRTGGLVQEMIHHLKYYRRPEIGRQLGEILGRKLAASPGFVGLDAIVPVPIHPTRRHQRGYNQAEEIAVGLAQVLGIQVWENALRRTNFRGSQTKRSLFERVENVAESFEADAANPGYHHLLLVDDVMTTGSTLDYCGNALLERHPDVKVSIATLAVTEN